MKRTFARLIAAVIIGVPVSALAGPIPLSYEIGPYGPTGGYSASWLHDANHCGGAGPDSGATLWKCSLDRSKSAVTGVISGTLDGGIFSIDSGTLMIAGMGPVSVTDGRLGGAFLAGAYSAPNDLLWNIVTSSGTFYFESMSMGSGGPNQYSPDKFILWGQTLGAYNNCTGPDCQRWGLDLYGERVLVPEPGALALFGIGLMGLTVIVRRKKPVTA